MDKGIFRKISDKRFELVVRLSPGAKKAQILGVFTENNFGKEIKVLKISVCEKPNENKANSALIEFLSKELQLPKTGIVIKHGMKSKRKIVEIHVKDVNDYL